MTPIFETIDIKNKKKPEYDPVDSRESEERKIGDRETVSMEEFFAAQKDFYRHYAGDSSITVKPADEAPEEVRTMAVDLKSGIMYVNPAFFEEKGYGLDMANFGMMHEHEHILELMNLLRREGGQQIWKKHAAELKSKKRYAILDNCIGDVKMNRSVLKKAPVLGKTEDNIYHEKLFPDTDFSKLPRHIQFSHAALYEARFSGEKCTVAPEVRAKLEELKNRRSKSGVSLFDYATSPYTPMEMRIKLQRAYFYPIADELFEEDVKKKQAEKKQSGGENKESGQTPAGEDEEEGEKNGDQQKSEKEKDKGADGQPSQDGKEGEESGELQDPQNYFRKEYAEFDRKNSHAIPLEDLEKAVEKYIAAKKGEKSVEEMSREAYAQAEGVTVAELDEYEKFWRELERMRDPETDETVVEELRAMFKKIINERKKKKYAPKYPTEEGEILAFPAEAVIAVRRGEREPQVWETVEPKEKPREMYGDFDVTLVADRSGSMKEDDVKYIEQRKAAALILEALKDFCDELEETRKDIEYDLNVRTEAWSFGDENQVEVLKPLSPELTEKQRVYVYKKLADASGNHTYDFLALEKIRDGISEKDLRKIRQGRLKKIIIVMSDGRSHGVSKVQEICRDLREKGVKIVGVGITKGGKSVETTYAPDGQVCENPANLPRVLGDLLKNELKDL